MNKQEIVNVLKSDGFTARLLKTGVISIRHSKLVNPADVRAKAAECLTREGVMGFHLKEVYAYQGSKKPWRTDEHGCVEFVRWETVQSK